MDLKRVYRKTSQGEESLKERALLPDTRLRAVLILVDGQHTGDQIARQLGKKFRPRATLTELEKLGLIEVIARKSDRKNARSGEEPAPAEAASGTAGESAKPMDAPVPGEGQPAQTAELGGSQDARRLESAAAAPEPDSGAPRAESPVESKPAAVELSTVVAEFAIANAGPGEPADTEPQSQEAPQPEPASIDDSESGPSPGSRPEPQPEPKPEPEPEPNAGPEPEPADPIGGEASKPPTLHDAPRERTVPLRSRAFGELGSRHEDTAVARHTWVPDAPSAVCSERRGTRPTKHRQWLRIAVLAALLLLVAGALARILVPWDSYRADIERRATAILGQPVRIEDLGLAINPSPGLRLAQVTVGTEPVLTATEVLLLPAWRSPPGMLSFDVDLRGVTAQRAALPVFCAAPGLGPATAGRIGALRLTELDLTLQEFALRHLRAEIVLHLDGSTPVFAVYDGDGHAKAELQPGGGGCRFTAVARSWTLPFRGGVLFDDLTVEGSVAETGARLEKIESRTLGGIIAGHGTLGWSPNASLELALDLRHLDLTKVLAALGTDLPASGIVDGKMQLSARASTPGSLGGALSGRGSVKATRGYVGRFDLVESVRADNSEGVHGGRTDFEQLSAQIQFRGGELALGNLQLGAGALTADGRASVDKGGQLTGLLNVRLTGSAGQVRTAVRIGGTLAAPELGQLPAAAKTTSIESH